MKRNGDIKSFSGIMRQKQERLQPKSNLNLILIHLRSIRMQRLALILIHLQSIPMQRLTLILMMKRHGNHHPNIHMQGPIIFKGFHLIQGKGFLFQIMMLMIKTKFGYGTLQRMQSNHMHTTLKSRKCMVKIDTSTLFGLRTTNG